MQSTADVPPETCEVDEPCKQPWDRLLHLAMLCQADVYISIFCRSDAPEKAIKPFSRTKKATLGLSLPKCLERAPKNTAIPKEADSPLQNQDQQTECTTTTSYDYVRDHCRRCDSQH